MTLSSLVFIWGSWLALPARVRELWRSFSLLSDDNEFVTSEGASHADFEIVLVKDEVTVLLASVKSFLDLLKQRELHILRRVRWLIESIYGLRRSLASCEHPLRSRNEQRLCRLGRRYRWF